MERRQFLTNSTILLFAGSAPLKINDLIQESALSSHQDLYKFSYNVKSVSEYLKSCQENNVSENVYLVYWSTDQMSQAQQLQNYCRAWSEFDNFKTLVEGMAAGGKLKALTSGLVSGEYYSIMVFEDVSVYKDYIDKLLTIAKNFPKTDGLFWKVTEGYASIAAGEFSPLHFAKNGISVS